MRPEDYPKVFPPDKERVIVLTPLDGRFDELKEEFKAEIKDIIGRREYRILVVVRDAAGNEGKAEVKTPYIRRFPNFGMFSYRGGVLAPGELEVVARTPRYEGLLKLAGEGKSLRFEGGLIISATYHPLIS